MSADFLGYIERQRQRLLAQRKKIDQQLSQLAGAEKIYRAAAIEGVAQRISADPRFGTPKVEIKTIKDRIQEIMATRTGGMTSNEILDGLKKESPGLTRTSLSPQLSRLKADGILVRDDATGRWQLAQVDLPTSINTTNGENDEDFL